MEKLDDFTLNILCNSEVIDVDQDALGQQARIVRYQEENNLVLAKPLEDGSLAVGLFNLGEKARKLSVTWKELQVDGPQRPRDLWRQTDLGVVDKQFEAEVGRHGVSFVRLWPAQK